MNTPRNLRIRTYSIAALLAAMLTVSMLTGSVSFADDICTTKSEVTSSAIEIVTGSAVTSGTGITIPISENESVSISTLKSLCSDNTDYMDTKKESPIVPVTDIGANSSSSGNSANAESDKEYLTFPITGIIQNGEFPDFNYLSDNSLSLHNNEHPLINEYKEAYNYIYEQIVSCGTISSSAIIDISSYNLSTPAAFTITGELLNYHPELFYVKGLGYRYYVGSNTVVYIDVEYKYYQDQLREAVDYYNSTMENIVSKASIAVGDTSNHLEVALFIHDYIVANYEYDDDLSIRDVYTFFKEGKGVCQAYTLAYMAVLNEFDIPCSYSFSDIANHIWNIVKIDGDWYHVDCTHDDPSYNIMGRIYHDYFLLSDEAIIIDEQHPNDFSAFYECSNSKYDTFYWRSISSPIVKYDNNWYYLTEYYNPTDATTQAAIFKSDSVLDQGTLSVNLSQMHINREFIWYAFNSPGSYWPGLYSGFGISGGLFYYNSPKSIYSYDPLIGKSEVVSTLSESELNDGYIYGIHVTEDYIYRLVGKNPNLNDSNKGKVTRLSLNPVVKVEILGKPTVDVYTTGSVLNHDGLSIKATYKDNTTITTSEGISCLYDFSTTGEKKVVVVYDGFHDNNTYFTVTVADAYFDKVEFGTDEENFIISVFDGGQFLLTIPENITDPPDTKSVIMCVYDCDKKLISLVYLDIANMSLGSVLRKDLSSIAPGSAIKVFGLHGSHAPTCVNLSHTIPIN